MRIPLTVVRVGETREFVIDAIPGRLSPAQMDAIDALDENSSAADIVAALQAS